MISNSQCMRRQLWKVEESTVSVAMKLCKVWGTATGRNRVQTGRDVAGGGKLYTG